RAEEMLGGAEGQQTQAEGSRVGIVGRERGREESREHDRPQERGRRERGRIAPEPPGDRAPVPHGSPRGGGALDGGNADGHGCQWRAIRGATRLCTMSTARFSRTKKAASTRITPWSTGMSRWK